MSDGPFARGISADQRHGEQREFLRDFDVSQSKGAPLQVMLCRIPGQEGSTLQT